MTYRGESPGKKIARMMFWQRTLARMTGPHRVLVLAGAGGDVSTLLGFGVPPSNIVACDIDGSAIAMCKERFPNVEAIHDDVREVAAKYRDITIAHLDWCGVVTNQLVEDTVRVVQRCGCGVFGIGYMRGRDAWLNGQRDELHEKAKRVKDRELWNKLATTVGLGSLAASGIKLVDDPKHQPKHQPKLDARNGILRFKIDDSAARYGWVVSQRESIQYHSRCAEDGESGSPMTYVLFARLPKGSDARLSTVMTGGAMLFSVPTSANTWAEVKRNALDDLAKGYDARSTALVYNLTESTVVCWKAHLTRGTYAKRTA